MHSPATQRPLEIMQAFITFKTSHVCSVKLLEPPLATTSSHEFQKTPEFLTMFCGSDSSYIRRVCILCFPAGQNPPPPVVRALSPARAVG